MQMKGVLKIMKNIDLLMIFSFTHKLCSFSLSSRAFLSRSELVFSLGGEQSGGGRLGNELIFFCFVSDDPYQKIGVSKPRVIFFVYAPVIHSQEAIQGCLATRPLDPLEQAEEELYLLKNHLRPSPPCPED